MNMDKSRSAIEIMNVSNVICYVVEECLHFRFGTTRDKKNEDLRPGKQG